MSTEGRSLELFFIYGKPDQMLTAEVFGWTGHILMLPRTQLAEALLRKEAKYTGVYLLIGENEQGALAYIGEAEDVGFRIKSHDAKKDWWTSAILITTSANTLHKAHVKYLESRLVEIAKKIGKIDLENGNLPACPSLTEASEANMEAFLEQILTVLPALRIDFLLANTRPATENMIKNFNKSSTVFALINDKFNINAKAVIENGEFIVQKGSQARKEWVGHVSKTSGYSKLCDQLVLQGVLTQRGNCRIFNENYAFNSPSAAAAVIQGRSSNGPTNWKVKGTQKSYKDWENEKLAAKDN
jgi:Domain of unknown function (DUF4357)